MHEVSLNCRASKPHFSRINYLFLLLNFHFKTLWCHLLIIYWFIGRRNYLTINVFKREPCENYQVILQLFSTDLRKNASCLWLFSTFSPHLAKKNNLHPSALILQLSAFARSSPAPPPDHDNHSSPQVSSCFIVQVIPHIIVRLKRIKASPDF